MGVAQGSTAGDISIHALLAESDGTFSGTALICSIISIHALLAESDNQEWNPTKYRDISIHALLAESDIISQRIGIRVNNFYPRSPCGERPGKG